METILHKAAERGGGDYGWLQTRYSFSFARWYEPSRMGFGALRVINDDVIAPLGRFEMHSHKDFEIITIPLTGAVTHEDSLGNSGEVRAGEVQAMSAGTGVTHSECNASTTEPLSLLQIWIEPNVTSAAPRYGQASFGREGRHNAWQVLVSGDGVEGSLPVYQNARIARADMQAGTTLAYEIAHVGNGAYLFVIEGAVEIAGEHLQKRDAIGIVETPRILITSASGAQVLLIEVPVR